MLVLVVALAGCEPVPAPTGEALPTCQSPETWYADLDGDGWGDPSYDGVSSCGPDCVFRARNRLDCDDLDRETTGLVGSVCPSELVGADTPYLSHVGRWDEYAVVLGDGPLTTPMEAAAACGRWGGEIAVFTDAVEFLDFADRMRRENVFAGWVGVIADADGRWKWERSSPLVLDSIGWCDGAAPVADGPGDRLVLAKRGEAWCFGRPEDAASAWGPSYGGDQAHLVCGRLRPYPENYEEGM